MFSVLRNVLCNIRMNCLLLVRNIAILSEWPQSCCRVKKVCRNNAVAPSYLFLQSGLQQVKVQSPSQFWAKGFISLRRSYTTG